VRIVSGTLTGHSQRTGEDAMKTASIHLRPTHWQQSVEHYPSINVEGRRFSARCTIEPGSELRMSNKKRLEDLPVEIQIFEAGRMQKQLAKLPPGSLGLFSFHDDTPPRADIPGMDAFLSGWFSLNAQSLEDAWQQVRRGGYESCRLMLHIGPVENPTMGWLWDVKKTPHLFIDTFTLSFHRLEPKTAGPVEKKAKSFWR
jgi:hypothetical protein